MEPLKVKGHIKKLNIFLSHIISYIVSINKLRFKRKINLCFNLIKSTLPEILKCMQKSSKLDIIDKYSILINQSGPAPHHCTAVLSACLSVFRVLLIEY